MVLFLALLGSLHVQSQDISHNAGQVGILVFQIGEYNKFESSHIGLLNEPSQQYALYKKLESAADAQTLLALAEDAPNAVVRLYAAKAYESKYGGLPARVSSKLKNDSASVMIVDGCLVDNLPVSEIYSNKIAGTQKPMFSNGFNMGGLMNPPFFQVTPRSSI